MKYLLPFSNFITEETINIPVWEQRPGNNFWVMPMMSYCFEISKEIVPKTWQIENGYKGSWFKAGEDNYIFFHLDELNYDYLQDDGNLKIKPSDYEEISNLRFEKFGLGTPILFVFLKDYQDGFKVKLAGSNTKLLQKLQIKGAGNKLYKSFVKEMKKPIYSDTAQTNDSKTKIWGYLLNDPDCEIVVWDQVNKKELEITEKEWDGKNLKNVIVNQNQPVYFGDIIGNKELDKHSALRNQLRRDRTRILKLKSVK